MPSVNLTTRLPNSSRARPASKESATWEAFGQGKLGPFQIEAVRANEGTIEKGQKDILISMMMGRDKTAIRFAGWPCLGSMLRLDHIRGECKGCTAGPLAKMVWYYHSINALMKVSRRSTAASGTLLWKIQFIKTAPLLTFVSDAANWKRDPTLDIENDGAFRTSKRGLGNRGPVGLSGPIRYHVAISH